MKYWLPVLAWMAVIFSASADTHSSRHSAELFEPLLRWLFPHLSQGQVDFCHEFFRKSCHLSVYCVLGLLLWRAIRRPQRGDKRPWRWDEAGLALTGVFAYAATDEFHQIFVPTRTAHVTDVLIDTGGGAVGLLLLWGIGKITRRW